MKVETIRLHQEPYNSFIVIQEKDHYTTLEELVSQLNKCNDWVESAEFGVRLED